MPDDLTHFDPTLNTAEALQLRARLRAKLVTKSLAVKAVALKFWTLLGVGVDVPLATRAAYMVVHRNVSAVLAPELTEEEAAEAALDDWVDDTGMVDESTGAEHETSEISFDQYTAGLIGIADMWTSSVDEGEYVRFLQKLYRRITVRAQAPRSRQRVLAPLSSLLGRGEDAWRAEDRDDDEDDDDEQLVVEDDVGEADDELVRAALGLAEPPSPSRVSFGMFAAQSGSDM